MNIDIQKSLNLIKGALLAPEETWNKYKEEEHTWQETAIVLAVPAIVSSVLLTAIFGWVFSSYTLFGNNGGVVSTILSLIMAFVGIALAAYIFSYFAGVFKGKSDFSKAFAALSLTAVPGYIGNVLGTLPMVGLLFSLGLGIYSLVLLYKIIPNYLEVPEEKRTIHFVVSLLSTFILMVILAFVLGAGSAGNSEQTTTAVSQKSGMFGSFGQHGNIMEAAGKDQYTPPKDGKITQGQMQMLIKTLEKAAAYREEQSKKLASMDKMAKKEDFSFADLGKLASGMSSAMSMANAEMEIVKTGGGNWAEYSWVKEQLRIAVMQKDINDAVKHNYSQYQKHESALLSLGF